MRILFCAYRDWALNAVDRILEKNLNYKTRVVDTNESFKRLTQQEIKGFDLMVFIGWSWIIPSEITREILCVGMHPSDLPLYRGGSPIQHQIINGVIDTKITLMTLSDKLDAGEIWMKEGICLNGKDMTEILKRLEDSTVKLIHNFLSSYPNIDPQVQDLSEGSYYTRRNPYDSQLNLDDFKNKSLIEIYDFIRCLTTPYPNAFIEDNLGNRLYFESVRYEQSKS